MTFSKRQWWMGLVLPIFLTAVSGCRVDTGLDKSKISSQLTELVSSGKSAGIKDLQSQPSATPDPNLQLDSNGKPTHQFQTAYAIVSLSVDYAGTLHMVRTSDSGQFGPTGPTGPTEYVISTDGGKTVAVQRQGVDYLKDLWATNPKEHVLKDLKVANSWIYMIADGGDNLGNKISIKNVSSNLPLNAVPIPSDLQTPEPIPNYLSRRLLKLAVLYNSDYPVVLAGTRSSGSTILDLTGYGIDRPSGNWILVRKSVYDIPPKLPNLAYGIYSETQNFSCTRNGSDSFEIAKGAVKKTIKPGDYRSCYIDPSGKLYLFSKETAPGGFAVIDLNRLF